MKLQLLAETVNSQIETDKAALKNKSDTASSVYDRTVADIKYLSSELVHLQYDEFKRQGIGRPSSKDFWRAQEELSKRPGANTFWIPSRYVTYGRYVAIDKSAVIRLKQLRAKVIELNNIVKKAKSDMKQAKKDLKGISIPHRREKPTEGLTSEQILARYNQVKDLLIRVIKSYFVLTNMIKSYNEKMVELYYPKYVGQTYGLPDNIRHIVNFSKYEYGRLRLATAMAYPRKKGQANIWADSSVTIIVDTKNPQKLQRIEQRVRSKVDYIIRLYKEWDYLDRYARAHKIAVVSDK